MRDYPPRTATLHRRRSPNSERYHQPIPAWIFEWDERLERWVHITRAGNEYRILGDLENGFWVARMFTKTDGSLVALVWGKEINAHSIDLLHGTWTFT